MSKKPRSRKIRGATASEFHVQKRTRRGLKGPERKKLLPPWKDVKDELKS